ncbi:MAG TPA: GNAT family N-acetyltransferase [bacterium]|nr:GNAT family N-acetyltransferase [bacterium]HQO33317.1 GNAT family N-acetyltransferase [bacterium]HQP97402.1 GNAT family N-acetyltransferase [bacterium]
MSNSNRPQDTRHDILSVRPMEFFDIPRCVELNRCVGWNQLEKDWQRFITLGPKGCFVAQLNGTVVGTVTTINYQNRFGWVGMVIVDPDLRRMGIGRRLLLLGIDTLIEMGVETVKLDATPQGKLLYDTLGFVDEYGAARWEGTASPMDTGKQAEPMRAQDMRDISALDGPIFGADRTRLIALYLQEFPDRCYIARSGHEITGYLCGRAGGNAEHIGPWVARDRDIAEFLLKTRFAHCAGRRIFVDTLERCPQSTEILQSLGFQIQRPFIRMYKGPNRYPGQPEFVYALSGPELG